MVVPNRFFWEQNADIQLLSTIRVNAKNTLRVSWTMTSNVFHIREEGSSVIEMDLKLKRYLSLFESATVTIAFTYHTQSYLLHFLHLLPSSCSVLLWQCMCDLSCIRTDFLKALAATPVRILCIWSTNIPDEMHCAQGHVPRLIPVFVCGETPVWAKTLEQKTDIINSNRLLYVNFTASYRTLKENEDSPTSRTTMERLFVQRELRANGFHQRALVPYEQMLLDMSACDFCVCPRGIGVDTHRFWEACMVGCAVITHDWQRLRSSAFGRFPAVWVRETVAFPAEEPLVSLRSCRMKPDHCLFIDEMGDVHMDRWMHVTVANLRAAHRWIGWKRSSDVLRHRVLSEGYWLAEIHRLRSSPGARVHVSPDARLTAPVAGVDGLGGGVVQEGRREDGQDGPAKRAAVQVLQRLDHALNE
jgi:hypothetical protein